MADDGKPGFGRRLKNAVADVVHARTGPLTRDLLLEPGKFGLGRVPARLAPDATTTAVCGFCSTGCGLKVHLRAGEATNLSPDPAYPVNLGMACPKGWEALAPLAAKNRGTTPLVRNAAGHLVPASWDDAVGTMVTRFKEIQTRHGPGGVAWLGTGQIVTEELAFLGALGKFGMGMIHGDGNTRQCMATAATAYKQAFGFDAPPFTYRDFEESDCIVLVGSNLCIAHPIMWERIVKNRRKPAIVAVDPRRTETAMAATHHLAIAPKSDLALFYGIAHILFERGWVKQSFIDAHTEGVEGFREHVAAFNPGRVAAATGLERTQIEELATLIHERERVSFWWTMGVNQSHQGTRTAEALVNLSLITGNIGRPGTGANSITGQCNAMGSRVFSNTTNLMGGHDFTDADDRRKVAEAIGIDEAHIPRENSVAYDQILEKALSGQIRGLWIVATNPGHSWINQRFFHDVVARVECLVVQDMYADTETARLAHVYLPAAGWGEKEGTFINSERRFGLTKKVARAPGQALADFHIFQLVAGAWGCGPMFAEWKTPEAVFQIMKRVSKGQACDITGITDYAMLDREGGVQWPLPEGSAAPARERRLFEDGVFFHPGGRAKILFEEPRPAPEQPDKAFPFTLLTGRGSSSQWHTETRTRQSAVLRKLAPQELHLEMAPADAEQMHIEPDEWVLVSSRRGSVRARAFVTPTIRAGQVFLAMHDSQMNNLTFPAFDPFSRQPAYKHCAVSVAKVNG
jgi:assimilatory nitrate reductase catalytic subunit